MHTLRPSGTWVVLLRSIVFVATSAVALAMVFTTPLALAAQARMPALPRFEDYPSVDAFSGKPAAVVLASARYGRTYRTRLRNGAQMGPNFAGAFTVVTWGCGSSCQVNVIIDARTGALSQQALRTENGLDFRRDSRLLVADPMRPGGPPLERCAYCGVPAAYEWIDGHFQPVGPGPHPHVDADP
jgi:hypothetical protein